MGHVVIVDSSPDFRQSLATALADRIGGSTITLCDEGEGVIGVLRGGRVDVIVVEAALEGGVDAVSVVLSAASRQKAGTVLVRLAEGEGSPVRNGVGMVVAGESEPDLLVEPIVSLLRGDRPRDFVLPELSLLRLLQVASVADWYGAFGVRDGRKSGLVVVSGGRVTDARFEDDQGEEALVRMLRLAGGTITETDPPMELRTTVTRHSDEILAEAAAYWDSDAADEEVELGDDELVDFLGVEDRAGGTADLFSEADLAELALDDSMAIPMSVLVGPGKGGG